MVPYRPVAFPKTYRWSSTTTTDGLHKWNTNPGKPLTSLHFLDGETKSKHGICSANSGSDRRLWAANTLRCPIVDGRIRTTANVLAVKFQSVSAAPWLITTNLPLTAKQLPIVALIWLLSAKLIIWVSSLLIFYLPALWLTESTATLWLTNSARLLSTTNPANAVRLPGTIKPAITDGLVWIAFVTPINTARLLECTLTPTPHPSQSATLLCSIKLRLNSSYSALSMINLSTKCFTTLFTNQTSH